MLQRIIPLPIGSFVQPLRIKRSPQVNADAVKPSGRTASSSTTAAMHKSIHQVVSCFQRFDGANLDGSLFTTKLGLTCAIEPLKALGERERRPNMTRLGATWSGPLWSRHSPGTGGWKRMARKTMFTLTMSRTVVKTLQFDHVTRGPIIRRVPGKLT